MPQDFRKWTYSLPGSKLQQWRGDVLDGKESAWNAGDLGLIPGSGRYPCRRRWQPTPVLLPGEFQGQRSLLGYSPWGPKELHTTEWLTPSFFSDFNNDVITRKHTVVSDRSEMEPQTPTSPNSLFLAFPCLPDMPMEDNLCNPAVAVTGLFISTKVLVIILYQISQDSYAKKMSRFF